MIASQKRLCAVFIVLLLVPFAVTAQSGIPDLSVPEHLKNEMIGFVKLAEKEDSFVIGESVESVTAERTVDPFFINKYETTYALWYEVRVRSEAYLGYVFQNPGQEGSSGRRGKALGKKEK